MRWALAVAAALTGIFLLGLNTGFEPYPQGDQLGPDPGETPIAYAQRAADSLAEADEPAFALVTFSEPLQPDAAADLLQPARRVNQIIVAGRAPIAVGEMPDRREVFGNDPLVAAVVWESGEVLRMLIDDPRVSTIEVLPADAVWGTFGIRI